MTLVKPVFPPEDIPVELSSKIPVVDVPQIAPKMEAVVVAISGFFAWGRFKFSSRNFPVLATEIIEPIVSIEKIITKKKIATNDLAVISPARDNLAKIGPIETGSEMTTWGILVMPKQRAAA